MRWTIPRQQAFLIVTLGLGLGVGCGKEGGSSKPTPGLSKFRALKNPSEAPDPIRAAAAAVVNIETERGRSGTGAFISGDGLLLTNDHVMGSSLCPVEGCYFSIRLDYEVGKPFQKPMKVFGKPVFASISLDAAVLQLHHVGEDGQPAEKMTAPAHLEFAETQALDLVGQTVYVVGHPHGALKKWNAGQVYSGQGKWFRSTTFTMPGYSGSPVLNRDGRIVGIHHRGSSRSESITAKDLRTFSIGTASAALLAAYKSGEKTATPKLMIALSAQRNFDESAIVKNEEIYSNAHMDKARGSNGAEVSIVDVLGAECDKRLAKEEVESLEKLEEDLAVCEAAVDWLDCTAPEKDSSYKSCPQGEAAKRQWLTRFEKAGEKVFAFNGTVPYYWRITAPGALETSEEAQLNLDYKNLTKLVDELDLPMSLPLAYHYAATGSKSQSPGMRSALEFLKSYDTKQHYEYFIYNIVWGLNAFAHHESLGEADHEKLFRKLLKDPKLSVQDLLLVERRAYSWGLL